LTAKGYKIFGLFDSFDCDNLFYRHQKGASPVFDENALVLRRNDQRLLTNAEFNLLADVPPEVEWFANIENPNTRRIKTTCGI